jgi:TRAF3-interacting protein 1
MAEEDFWSETIAAYAPLALPAPALTEKLLKRPPFRFIFDLITAINQRFNAYGHLFSPEEQDSAAIDTKEKKIAYLQKIIDFIQLLLGRQVDVNTKKIVAGSEPERTNKFLRDVAMAVGYAQQYNQHHQAAAAPPPPPPAVSEEAPPPPPPPSGTSPGSNNPRKPNLKLNVEHTVNAEQKKEVIAEAGAVMKKVTGYGLHLDGEITGNKISQEIRAMELELKSKEIPETKPSTMPEEQLVMAIQRQIDSIIALKGVIDDNDNVCSKLIEVNMTEF